MASLLAVLASFANALSAVFQRIGVQNAPADAAMSLALVRYALRHAIWFLGVAMILVGFLLQAVALRFGNLTSVQPLVTTELLFLVLILGAWFHYPLGVREWGGSAAAAGGLATFLAVAAPGGGDVVPTFRTWTVTIVAVCGAAGACAALGFTGPRWFRAAMFGASGAVLFALSAALTKQFTTLVTEGWDHVFTSWVPYALVASGVVGLFLIQSSFHAGPITASQATLTIVDPLVSVIIGIYLFHDRLATGAWRVPVELAAGAAVVGGVLLLSTSPLVAGAADHPDRGDQLVRQARPGRPDPEAQGADTTERSAPSSSG